MPFWGNRLHGCKFLTLCKFNRIKVPESGLPSFAPLFASAAWLVVAPLHLIMATEQLVRQFHSVTPPVVHVPFVPNDVLVDAQRSETAASITGDLTSSASSFGKLDRCLL